MIPQTQPATTHPELRVTLGALTLNNPVLVAAGTFGYGVEFLRAVQVERLGGIITKTLTRSPRAGNPPPRLVETPGGLINAVGLQNIGLEAFLDEKLPQLRPLRVPVIVSLLGESPEEASAMAAQLDRADGVSALELNLSCPNLHQPKPFEGERPLLIAQDAQATHAVVRAVCQQTSKPVIAKLSPDVSSLIPIAQAAEQAGASAVSIANTFMAMSIDPGTRRSRLGVMTGGLSGPAIRPLTVYRVWYTARTLHIPVIGVGGIVRTEDALEFILAGARAVAVGTANFANPRAPLRVLQGLERYVRQQHVTSIHELCGAVQPPPSSAS